VPAPFSHFGIDTIGDFAPSRFGGHKKALVLLDYGTSSGYIIGMRDSTVPSLRRAAGIFVAYAKHDLEQAKVDRPELTLGPNLTSDGEKGLRHDGFNEVFASNGFEVRRYGAPYASWFNGKVESYIGHVLSTGKAITAARAVPPDLWIDLLANAVSLLDLRPTKGNPDDECPYIERTRTQPTQAMINSLRIPFLERGVRWIPRAQRRGKLAAAGVACWNLGFCRYSNCHLVLTRSETGVMSRVAAHHVQWEDAALPPIVATGGIGPTFDEDWTDAAIAPPPPPHPPSQVLTTTTAADATYHNIGAALHSEYAKLFQGPNSGTPLCVTNERDAMMASGALSQPIPRSSIGSRERVHRLKAIYTVKCDADGTPVRGKLRCVLATPNQQRGVDYYDAATHQLNPAIYRLVMSIQPPTPRQMMGGQSDVPQAFTAATLHESEMPSGERVLVEFPKDIAILDDYGNPTVHKLQRWLYGMAGAGLAWERRSTTEPQLSTNWIPTTTRLTSQRNLCLL